MEDKGRHGCRPSARLRDEAGYGSSRAWSEKAGDRHSHHRFLEEKRETNVKKVHEKGETHKKDVRGNLWGWFKRKGQEIKQKLKQLNLLLLKKCKAFHTLTRKAHLLPKIVPLKSMCHVMQTVKPLFGLLVGFSSGRAKNYVSSTGRWESWIIFQSGGMEVIGL